MSLFNDNLNHDLNIFFAKIVVGFLYFVDCIMLKQEF